MAELNTLMAMLSRSVVQYQVAAIALATAVAVGLALGLHRLERDRGDTAWRRLPRLVRRLIARAVPPLAAAFLLALAAALLRSRGLPDGIVRLALLFFLILAAYLAAIGLLFVRLTFDRAQRYQRRLFLPLFALALLWFVLDRSVGFTQLASRGLFTVAGTEVFVTNLLAAVLIALGAWTVGWISADLITHEVMPRTGWPSELRGTLCWISWAIVASLGALLVLTALGMPSSTLTALGAGLAVGIGFGLNKAVANLVSGMMLLSDRSMLPGDIVEIGEDRGIVKSVSIRATTVTTYDGVDVLVPNEVLLGSNIRSLTMRDRRVRLQLPVGASYGAEPPQIIDTLLEIGQAHPLVLAEPEPNVFFDGFGDSSLLFRLLVWIDDPMSEMRVRTDLNGQIWARFRELGIEIPFPQRDLHLRSGWPQGGAEGPSS